jgi:dolichyl-phosphate beta-glucosyltransferase
VSPPAWIPRRFSGMHGARMRRVALVVPCFNEEPRLDVGAFGAARLEGLELELVFVDDGSSDGTRRVLGEVRRRRAGATTIVALAANAGKAEAVRRGVLDALDRGPDAVGFWDADLATPLTELPAFVEVLEQHPHVDVVVGSRVKLMGRSIERRSWRHYVGRVFATLASMTLELPIYDTQCGAKLFRVTPATGATFASPFLARWVFDVELLARWLAAHPGGRAAAERSIYELPLGRWADVRGSKVKAADVAAAAIDLARIHWRYPRTPA